MFWFLPDFWPELVVNDIPGKTCSVSHQTICWETKSSWSSTRLCHKSVPEGRCEGLQVHLFPSVSTIKGHIQESRPDVRNLCFGLLGPPFSAVNMEKQLRIKLAASSKPFCQSGKTPVTDLIHWTTRFNGSSLRAPPSKYCCKISWKLQGDGARCISPLSLLHSAKKCIHIFVWMSFLQIHRSSQFHSLEVATHWLMARKVQLFFSSRHVLSHCTSNRVTWGPSGHWCSASSGSEAQHKRMRPWEP